MGGVLYSLTTFMREERSSKAGRENVSVLLTTLKLQSLLLLLTDRHWRLEKACRRCFHTADK